MARLSSEAHLKKIFSNPNYLYRLLRLALVEHELNRRMLHTEERAEREMKEERKTGDGSICNSVRRSLER
ncbi:hypothetical protein J31TS4_31200 [Paenibacillus sp. J31TS4]|nr:hypothetical protein J31TS4_31200 [Paenibacillus sp. J31TS4]